MFDYFAKPQSDDWGFQAFIDEYGMIGSFLNMRATFQTSPYMLVVMFPFILLQKVIPYFILLLIIQLSLPVSLFLLLRKFLFNSVSKWEEFKVFLILFNISILTCLTAWNTNTFQNAVFWLTGALAYILPIAMYILFIERMIKINKSLIDKILIFTLVFLLVGVQINYIVIFSIFFILILFFKVIQLDKFFYAISDNAQVGCFKDLNVRDGYNIGVFRYILRFFFHTTKFNFFLSLDTAKRSYV
jgi:hypothetical protein